MGWQSRLFPEVDESLCSSLEKQIHGLHTESRWKRRSPKSILKKPQECHRRSSCVERPLFANLHANIPYDEADWLARSVRFTSLALVVQENRSDKDEKQDKPHTRLFYTKQDYQVFREQDLDLVNHILNTQDTNFLQEHSLAGMEYKLATCEQQDARKEAQKASIQVVLDLQREHQQQQSLLQRQRSRSRRRTTSGAAPGAQQETTKATTAFQDTCWHRIAQAYQKSSQGSVSMAYQRARTASCQKSTSSDDDDDDDDDLAELGLCEYFRHRHQEAMAQLLLQKVTEEVRYRQQMVQQGTMAAIPAAQEGSNKQTTTSTVVSMTATNKTIPSTSATVSLRSLLLAQRRGNPKRK